LKLTFPQLTIPTHSFLTFENRSLNMQYDLLLSAIAKHISLTAEEQQQLIGVLSFKKVKKKQFLYQEGDISKQAVFVTHGCLRSYSIDKNGFEHILQFAPPGWWISDMRSMITQEPGTLYIDAVDDSEIILIQKTDLDKLYAAIPKLERFFRILAENSLATYQHRLIDNLSLTAAERYSNFCKRYPSLIENIPQKQVAAYIGVTPEFLSKMLNKAPSRK
jgi:CRP/FNR family transcriptional regulator, anaerobic regulatory protein